ncbi:hypothetical protein WOB59_14260 [Methylocystis sp. IM4]|uniref:hypothetical protein n=1 Tax=Methylocystis sp. IM4 TaxID=3136560 RepID=UPI00311A57F5
MNGTERSDDDLSRYDAHERLQHRLVVEACDERGYERQKTRTYDAHHYVEPEDRSLLVRRPASAADERETHAAIDKYQSNSGKKPKKRDDAEIARRKQSSKRDRNNKLHELAQDKIRAAPKGRNRRLVLRHQGHQNPEKTGVAELVANARATLSLLFLRGLDIRPTREMIWLAPRRDACGFPYNGFFV